MPETLVDVVYCGEVIAPDRQRVTEDFAKLFKLDLNKAKKILASSRLVIKKGVSPEQGERYKSALSRIGVLVNIETHIADPDTLITLESEDEDMSAQAAASDDQASASDSEPEHEPEPDYSKLAVEDVDNSAGASTNFALIEDGSKTRRMAFTFTGSGSEFFKIWIVNIALSIVTLGIYSAWAKVRTNRYFYGNTWINESAFEYLANPVSILKGRVIVVVFFLVYNLSAQFAPWLSVSLAILFIILLPWLIAAGLRFRMRNTAYRNIRFGFDGGLWEAAKAYPLMFILVPLTLGLLVPFMIFLQARYRVDNTRYGIDLFSFSVSPREYYRIFIKAFLGLLAAVLAGVLGMAMSPIAGGLIMMAGYALVISYVNVETTNILFDNSHLGDHLFSSSMDIGSYFKLFFVNAVLMILTLGLFYPWARVRVARYRAEKLMMIVSGNLNSYVASQEEETSALGEEAADLFEFDIGF